MAKTNAERQRIYRSKRTGTGGRHERINCYISISTKRNVERLACYYRLTLAETLEKIINERAATLLERLSDEEREMFFEERAGAQHTPEPEDISSGP
ncbi:hypothetical protein [Cupriavidus plantarum]|uniref:Protein CopB n=1 Tax=Cupriavidus plantarum TaxID=942865 RepID=A0A316F1G9_9BURK|nr:hypothetical protein [Cupriavidus plantarum]PWK37353.1 hypothetical protein C7419_1011235 [Cupriavidus plantarum]REF01903.1 hypothetical protein C7418_0690 [Cupriavidus plantarum]